MAGWLSLGLARLQQFRLGHPDLDFHVDVSVHERDGRFMATADLATSTRW